MNRVLVSEFPQNRRCKLCDIILSASLWDTKPVAIRIRKKQLANNVIQNRGNQYECIQCATKERLRNGKEAFRRTTLEEVDNFLRFMFLKVRLEVVFAVA